jgi:hypothetical protein
MGRFAGQAGAEILGFEVIKIELIAYRRQVDDRLPKTGKGLNEGMSDGRAAFEIHDDARQVQAGPMQDFSRKQDLISCFWDCEPRIGEQIGSAKQKLRRRLNGQAIL